MTDFMQFEKNHNQLFRIKTTDPSSNYDYMFVPLFVSVAFTCAVLLIMLFEVLDEQIYPVKKKDDEVLTAIEEEGEEEEEEYSSSEEDCTDLLNEVLDEGQGQGQGQGQKQEQDTPEESNIVLARPLEELTWHKGCSKHQKIQVKMPKINPVSDETYKKMILKMSRLENSLNTINGNLESVLKLH
jgi:hypothetical protein